ncbi:hypothetical protein KCP77_05965 [Salmonella enterica subsp. enterica]|nr:hypothetical protein KCP77_05965 [Salmonella enterica subsp. enterica]
MIIRQFERQITGSHCGNWTLLTLAQFIRRRVIGALLSQRPARTDSRLNDVYFWSVLPLGIGILLVMKCANLPVMVLATLVGALIGEFLVCWKRHNGAVAKNPTIIYGIG